jgi:lipopolysaccharide transport system permease protein
VTKIYFPRILIPAAAVAACLVDFAFAFAVYFLFLAAYGMKPSWAVFWVPALTLLTSMLALGVGLWMAALNVRYRDVRYALPFLIQLWMFASPVIYPSNMVPADWRTLYFLNPVAGLIEGFRASLLGLPLQPGPLMLSMAAGVILLVGGAYYFRRTEARFADVI